MLPVCSATSSCCSNSQILLPRGLRPLNTFWKGFDCRCNVEDRVGFGLLMGIHPCRISIKTQATKTVYSSLLESTADLVSTGSCPNELDPYTCLTSGIGNSFGSTNEFHPVGSSELKYIEFSNLIPVDEGLADFKQQFTENTNDLVGIAPENYVSLPEPLALGSDSLSSVNTRYNDSVAALTESFSSSLNKGENAIQSTLDTINSSISSFRKDASEALNDAFGSVFSTVDQTGEVAGKKLSSISDNLLQSSSKAADVASDLLRHTILIVENSITNGVSFLVYSYGSAKELLPPEIRNALDFSEDKTIKVLRPVGTVIEQLLKSTEWLERNLGLDPEDPIVQFVLFLGTSTTFLLLYRLWVYGGYAGDLSPESTLDLLKGKENAVLIDVRPEGLRERDGIPDLRRTARFRYSTVNPLEVEGQVRKMLKGGRDVNDALTAVVIKNLKTVQDRSKVIVMDADGTSSKGIARALRKFGIKRPYLVQGGFKAWIEQDLRIKEPKPETAFTILNEEAEAILEDINPSPFQVLGFGVGSIAAFYGLLEWEKSLQLIGVVGLSQTIFRRIASYEGAEDFKQDVRLLFSPVKVGAEAFSWAAGKIETNGIGLPTSPSSLDVQNRVMQAAAKHESQPSDTDAAQDPSSEEMASNNQNIVPEA